MKLYKTLKAIIEKAYPQVKGVEFLFIPTPENQEGDFGLACFRFTDKFMMKPHEVASMFASIEYPSPVTSAKQVGPYVNYTLDRTAFATELINDILKKGSNYGSDARGMGKKVLLEHTSINPNASPHIGRSRNGLIGDTLARLLRFEGYNVDVHYYVNDMGKQIGLLVLQTKDKENLTFDDILGEYIAANTRAKDDPDFENEAFKLLMSMEQDDPEVMRVFTELVDRCLEGQLEILKRLGLSYDTFDRESCFLHDPRMEEVITTLKNKEALFMDDEGRMVVDMAKLGYKPKEGRYIVLMRANGSSMYMYRDIAYTLEKIERADGDNLIVLGEDHKMYFEQLAAIIRALGKNPPEPIHYSYILLREGKMSTRNGTVVLLSDFLDEAIRQAREKVDAQWPEMPEKDCAEIARIIGVGAVRFTILSVRTNRNVIFNWDTALSFTGNSGPYIQYSCTRISSIIRKYGRTVPKHSNSVMITREAEWSLILRLADVERGIGVALETRNPAIIANTALEIARCFSVFYNECPVLNAGDEAVSVSRIGICFTTRLVLVTLLDLLGIEAPERM